MYVFLLSSNQELAPKVAADLLQLWDTHQLRRPHSASGSGRARGKKGGVNQQQQQQQQQQQPQQHGSRPWHQQRTRGKKDRQAGKDSPLQADSSSGSSPAHSGSSNNSPAHQASANSATKQDK